jgi:hypothetical protein
MSYLQIELGGKTRGLKFNQLAIELIAKNNDAETLSAYMYSVVYGGLRGNSYVKREEVDYTFEDVCDWVDNLDNKEEVMIKVSNTLAETQTFKKLISSNEEAKEESKKKVKKNSPTKI